MQLDLFEKAFRCGYLDWLMLTHIRQLHKASCIHIDMQLETFMENASLHHLICYIINIR